MFTYYYLNLNVYLIYFTTFIYVNFIKNVFISVLLNTIVTICHVYVWCENDAAIENSLND